MPTQATTEHEPFGMTPGQPGGDLTRGLRAGIHGDQAWRPNLPQGGAATAEVFHLRFDRIEDRLASLERMLSELIRSRCEPQTDGVRPAPERQPEVAPAPSRAEAPSQEPAPAQSPQLPAWEQPIDDEELDVSVRDYVERLLKRGGADPLDHPAEASRVPAIEPPDAASQQDADAESPLTAMEQPVPEEEDASNPPAAHRFEDAPNAASGPSILIPRRLPLERDPNLDAMRMVANLSATAAIRTYEKSQAARKTFERLPLLLIGSVCGLMLLYSAFSSGGKAMLVGAGVALIGAALTAWQVLFILRRWLAASQPVQDS